MLLITETGAKRTIIISSPDNLKSGITALCSIKWCSIWQAKLAFNIIAFLIVTIKLENSLI